MTEQDNIELVERFYEIVWNERNLDAIDKIFADDVETGTSAAVPENLEGREAVRTSVGMYHQAFSDGRILVDEIFASGPWVAVVWSGRGTHDGELGGMPPTDNQVEVTGIDAHRVEDGRIVESRSEFDGLGMLVQMGVIEPFEL